MEIDDSNLVFELFPSLFLSKNSIQDGAKKNRSFRSGSTQHYEEKHLTALHIYNRQDAERFSGF